MCLNLQPLARILAASQSWFDGCGASRGQQTVVLTLTLETCLSRQVTFGTNVQLSFGVAWLFLFLTFEPFSTQGPLCVMAILIIILIVHCFHVLSFHYISSPVAIMLLSNNQSSFLSWDGFLIPQSRKKTEQFC